MLIGLGNLKSIYCDPLPFPQLKKIEVTGCPKMKKLPLDSSRAMGHKIVVKGNIDWWIDLQWEDRVTQKSFFYVFWITFLVGAFAHPPPKQNLCIYLSVTCFLVFHIRHCNVPIFFFPSRWRASFPIFTHFWYVKKDNKEKQTSIEAKENGSWRFELTRQQNL